MRRVMGVCGALCVVAAEAAAQPAGDPPPDPIGWPEPDPAPPAPDPAPADPAAPTDPAPPPPAPTPATASDPFASVPTETIDPVLLEHEPPVYPRSFVERPFLLPDGAYEVSLDAQTFEALIGNPTSFVSVLAIPQVFIGFGKYQLHVEADVLVGQSLPEGSVPADPERFAAISVGVDRLVGEDVAVFLGVRADQPLADVSTYTPRVGLNGKQRLGARSAIGYLVMGAFERVSGATERAAISENTLFGVGVLTLQAQVSPYVALEAYADLQLIDHLDVDNMPMMPSSYFRQIYGARMLVSATANLDLYLGADLLAPSDAKSFVVGFAVRRVP